MEPERVQPEVSVTEPVEVELSVPAAQAAAAAPAAGAATVVRLVSEALSVLALELAAAREPGAGVLTGVPAAVEPAAATAAAAEPMAARKPAAGVLMGVPAAVEPVAATAAASAIEPMAAKGERPVLANGPAAASKECWVLNPIVGPKLKLRKLSAGRRRQRLPPQELSVLESLCQGGSCPRRPGGQRWRLSLYL